MTRAGSGHAEYLALSKALDDVTPACSNDWRYIQDREVLDPDDVAAMQRACRACPVQSLCRTYGDAARPSAGMWAGRFWGRKERTPKSGDQS
ncbi:WhiB family transcriptional regulator [Microbacterium sp. UFMG61]|uniref:WhiB family transcriptional regulator n=1 Tax=Microbacterium sp. UFMG61 TaxID=2745935 RepID=UPI0018901B10|nr:WhiB family transcriptional regulator [Microbacterium sp. UFMG61]